MKIRAWLCLYNLLRAKAECGCRAQGTGIGCCQQNSSWLQGHDELPLLSCVPHPVSCAFPSLPACLFRNTGAGPCILGTNAIKPNVCNYFSLACGLWNQRWWNTMWLMYFAMNKCIHIMWFSPKREQAHTKVESNNFLILWLPSNTSKISL